MANHRDGKKVGGNHTTIIDAAVPLVDAARRMPEVSRVSFGQIRTIPTGQRRLKVDTINNGTLKLTVRGNTSVQEVFVYTSATKRVQEELERVFNAR